MQGLTNRALRSLFIEWVRPDVVFTEFVQVRPGTGEGISEVDAAEIAAGAAAEVPLVVQLMGGDPEGLVAAAQAARTAEAVHLNINMGCPYGRMTRNAAGGALLKDPSRLPETLAGLRAATPGSFSVKLRSGHDDPCDAYGLIPYFEEAGVDFLILHPRTVTQKFEGPADHAITRRFCELTSLPVIANGDIFGVADGERLLSETRAAGLMLGRGAISDPWLFERLRGGRPAVVDEATRRGEVRAYLLALAERYRELFHGDTQVLFKLKEVVNQLHDEAMKKPRKALRKCKRLDRFLAEVEAL